MCLLLISLTSCLSSPEIVLVYPKVPAPVVIERPIRPEWVFLTLEVYPEYVLLTISDSVMLKNYIIDMQTYGKLLQTDIDYYKQATAWETLQE